MECGELVREADQSKGAGMSTLREAAQQALETLEKLWLLGDQAGAIANPAITTLRAALAEPESVQENATEAYWLIDHTGRYYPNPKHPLNSQRTEPKQEPVAWVKTENFVDDDGLWSGRIVFNQDGDGMPLYTHPTPQRQPLTDEEISALFPAHLRGDYKDLIPYSFARAIERAHGIGGEA